MPTDFSSTGASRWAADGEVDVAAVGDSFLRQCWIGATTGARAVGPTDDDDVGFAWSGRRRASAARYLRGHRSTPAKFCSSDMGRLASLVLRCLVGVQRAARNDQQNLAALSILVAFNARARGERGDVDGFVFDRREPAGRQMVRSTSRPSSISFYAVRIGATMELGRSGRPTMTMSASPGRGGGVRAQRGTYGVIDQRRPNSAAVTWGAWPRSFYDVWSGCSARLGTISRIWPRYPFSLPSTRAREASGAMSTDFSSTGASRLGGRW